MAEPELAICPLCDWAMQLPALAAGESAYCPRCNHRMRSHTGTDPAHELAWNGTALITLAIALSFNFLHFDAHGAAHTIGLLDAPAALLDPSHWLVALAVSITTVLLPAAYLLVISYLNVSLVLDRPLPGARPLAHWQGRLRPWMMADVFVVGVLVGLVKVVSLANISVGPAFYAFCSYALLLLRSMSMFDPQRFWRRFASAAPSPWLVAGRPAAGQGAYGCASCGAPVAIDAAATCSRCGRFHLLRRLNRLQWTWALIIAAAVLLIPANTLIMLKTVTLSWTWPSTIIGGVRVLIQEGSWPIAAIIFVASIVVPVVKILALGWLCLKVRSPRPEDAPAHQRLYRFTEIIGRWSMIDIFVVTVLAALIQGSPYAAVYAGPAAVWFALVVLLTMAAVATFDPRLIWQDRAVFSEQDNG